MDNLTHSMTAALTAKFVDKGDPAQAASRSRTIFWLLIASVNFPDLDVVMALFRDPILTIKTHRWITHSVLAAPLFAVIPAAIFYRFSKLKNFRLLWLVALIGIYIHIVSDLVTPYGTMLLAPFSNHRFTLSSQFIVDLYFTFGLLAFILLGRYHVTRRKLWHKVGLIFMVAYIAGTFCLQGAVRRGRQVEHLPAVVREPERGGEAAERHALGHRPQVLELGARRAEEPAPRRRVEEQVVHLDEGAGRMRRRDRAGDAPAFAGQRGRLLT